MTSVCVKVLAPIFLSSAGSVMAGRRGFPGKRGTLHHAAFGSASQTSAVSPSPLTSAFSMCAAECLGAEEREDF